MLPEVFKILILYSGKYEYLTLPAMTSPSSENIEGAVMAES